MCVDSVGEVDVKYFENENLCLMWFDKLHIVLQGWDNERRRSSGVFISIRGGDTDSSMRGRNGGGEHFQLGIRVGGNEGVPEPMGAPHVDHVIEGDAFGLGDEEEGEDAHHEEPAGEEEED
eukprot:c16942_g1_i1 orf=1-360(-)